jgi:glycosyltransferase involved in cell wall biosynthesis
MAFLIEVPDEEGRERAALATFLRWQPLPLRPSLHCGCHPWTIAERRGKGTLRLSRLGILCTLIWSSLPCHLSGFSSRRGWRTRSDPSKPSAAASLTAGHGFPLLAPRMRVTFVLPGYAERPNGGYIVVFRYANELSRKGHDVSIVHARIPVGKRRHRATDRFMRNRRWSVDGRPTWFELDPRVKVRIARYISNSRIPDGDAVFATACVTAQSVNALGPRKGKKLYLVQGYEDWMCGEDDVAATWKLPLHKVVSSQWLFDIGIGFGERARLSHITPGIETELFRLATPPAQRKPLTVVMLAHNSKIKGLSYAIRAIEITRTAVPALEVVAFGAEERPSTLPLWVRYVENPTRPQLADLYNSGAIFLHSSLSEGWPLPPAEAMACGCALVASDSGGVRDYAIDGETALLRPAGDSRALGAAVTALIENVPLRLRLAKAGRRAVIALSPARSAAKLETLLLDLTS